VDVAEILIAAIVVTGLAIVVAPVALGKARDVRGARSLRCPKLGCYAAVEFKTLGAVLGALGGRESLKVKDCSLWPTFRGCEERCLEGFRATIPSR
jgi:hypothetical protein